MAAKRLTPAQREERARAKELIDYLFTREDFDIEACVLDVISDAASDRVLFRCAGCERIYAPIEVAVTNRAGDWCMYCDEDRSIQASDVNAYNERNR